MATGDLQQISDDATGLRPTSQTEEELREVQMVLDFYEEGKQWRQEFDKDWKEFQNFYDDKQWETNRPKFRASPVANICKAVVDTTVPIMTDAQPGFSIAPADPSDYDFADLMAKLTESWWVRRGVNHTLVETLTVQSIYDIGIQKVVWNPELENGSGDADVIDIDPQKVFVKKSTIDFDKNCPWVVEEVWKPLGEVKRAFPEYAQLISASGNDSVEEKSKTYGGDVTVVSPVSKDTGRRSYDVPSGNNDAKEVKLLECWCQDDTVDEYQEEIEPGVVETKQKKRFPKGKLITIYPDKRLRLQSVENPYSHGKFPYVRYVEKIKPRSFMGEGSVRSLVPVNKLINKTLANIFDCMALMGNPVWIVDANSGVKASQLTNGIGQVITKNPGTTVQREAPDYNLAPIFQLYETLMALSDQISGIHDVTQGRKPTGITAAEAINELQEAAQTRIRLKERNLQVSLTKMGYLVTALFMQYYREPRVVKITGKKGWPEYFEFFVKDVGEGKVQPVKRGYTFSEENKQYTPDENWTTGNPSKGVFDIEVVSGTSLPYMKEKRGTLARELFKDGVIDAEELLTILDWPRKEEVMRRVEQQKQKEAAGGPSGAPPPVGGQ